MAFPEPPPPKPPSEPPHIGSIEGDILGNGDADIQATPKAEGHKIGWVPHDDYTLIISFDEPDLVKTLGGGVLPQTFAIPKADPTGAEPQEYSFQGKDKEAYEYTALLVTGAGTYVTLKRPDVARGEVPPRRPRIRVGIGVMPPR